MSDRHAPQAVYQTPGLPPKGLVLSRRPGETVLVRDAQTQQPLFALDVIDARQGVVRLRFRAGAELEIVRTELLAPESPTPVAPAA